MTVRDAMTLLYRYGCQVGAFLNEKRLIVRIPCEMSSPLVNQNVIDDAKQHKIHAYGRINTANTLIKAIKVNECYNDGNNPYCGTFGCFPIILPIYNGNMTFGSQNYHQNQHR